MLRQGREFPVFGPEFMPPRGNAVGLVNRDDGKFQPPEAFEHAGKEQALGRDVKNIKPPRHKIGADTGGVLGFQFGMQRARIDAKLPQGRHLIVHEGDQREMTRPVPGRASAGT